MSRVQCVLAVRGLGCPTEAEALRRALDGQPGVFDLRFDLVGGTLAADLDPAVTDADRLIERVRDGAGMEARLVTEESADGPGTEAPPWLERWGTVVASGLALLAGVAYRAVEAPGIVSLAAFGLAILAGAVELAPKALRALRSRRIDIHVLMTAAIVGALGLGEWDEAATVAFLFGLSEALEALSLERARNSVRRLLEITPELAERIGPDGAVEEVPAAEIRVGDRVRVRAGNRIPVDGTIALGRSSVDQSMVTGESVPLALEAGDPVYAGTVNGEGTVEVEATKLLGDSVVAAIVERVRAAQAGRTPIERTIEQFAAWYTPCVLVLAAMVMVVPPLLLGASAAGSPGEVWRTWFLRGLVVLVISCPCALIIGTPVAVVSALTAAARRGILIKGGQFLEAFGRLRVLAFDKTGTLTVGAPDVVEIVPAEGREGDDVLRIAAALGDRGGHVVGRAIARHARGLQLEVPEAHDYEAVPGLGASGQVDATRYHIGSHRFIDQVGLCHEDFHASMGAAEEGIGTAVALTGAGGPMGWIRLADRPRPEAARVLDELRRLGIETVMLTGDNSPTAAAIADELGIVQHRSNMLPDDKARVIGELDSRHGPTGMVGDGVNDAPALAAARVSVTLGGISTGVALETADIVLMADDLGGLPWLVRHSRRTRARIVQNIVLAVVSKLLVLGLAMLGWADLWMAIAADLGVSLLVVANALRLLRSR